MISGGSVNLNMSIETKRIIRSVVFAFLVLLFLLLASYLPSLFFIFSTVAIVLILIFFFFSQKSFAKPPFSNLSKIFLPILLTLSLSSFAYFETNGIFKIIILLFGFFSFYLFFSRFDFPLPEEVGNKVTYFWLDFLIFITAFLFYLEIYNFELAFRLPFFVVLLISVIFSFFLLHFNFWARGRVSKFSLIFSLLYALSVLEILLTLSFWQENPVSKSLIILTALYFFSGVLDHKLKGSLRGKKILEYLLVSFFILVLIVLLR